MLEQRLDKWLWCARLTKTRSGAARLIADGKVRINGERVLKPSRLVHDGDVVTAANLGRLSVVRVLGMADRRGSPSVAQALYEDLTPKVAMPENPGALSRLGKRPTKRDRRRLDVFRSRDA
ncbi:MAG: RNA-binding S4 domain-containing protein [Methyloceanibacter sp.]|uniref:RNA-binding S4 domain-containing protein n=1 Tax=Methyloceanibacter sp. TaxID=1965321 RepID=UPI003D6D19CB